MQASPLPAANIADLAFRRGMVALRVLILAAYLGLSGTGALESSKPEFLAFASVLAIYTAWFAWTRLVTNYQGSTEYWFTRHFDIVLVSVLLVALRDIENPVWTVYFIC